MSLKLGFNDYMSDDVYHGDLEYLSSSVLKDIIEDPAKVRNKRMGTAEPEGPKSAFIVGQYIHWKILEPHRKDAGFATFGGAARRGKRYQEFLEEHSGKTVILRSEKLESDDLVEVINKNDLAKTLFSDGTPEQTVCGIIDDVKIKVRADFLKSDAIVDLKTTSFPVNPESIKSIILKRKYHLSAALYIDIVNQHLDTPIKDFVLVFANKKTHEIGCFRLSEDFLNEGRRLYMYAISKYKRLLAEKYFTKEYKPSIIEIDL